jgi:hypothetical protein
MLMANQKTILNNQIQIIENQKKLDQILDNQKKLDQILGHQAECKDQAHKK